MLFWSFFARVVSYRSQPEDICARPVSYRSQPASMIWIVQIIHSRELSSPKYLDREKIEIWSVRCVVQSWSLISTVRCGAGGQLSAMKTACHDLVLQSTTVPHRTIASAGVHLGAGIVIWQGTALMRDHVCTCHTWDRSSSYSYLSRGMLPGICVV